MLQQAPATGAEMAADRVNVMGPARDAAVLCNQITRRGPGHVAARCRDAIAFGGDAEDFFWFCHRNDRQAAGME
jgi:hypothetical protein